jgi:hypothetical protein
MILFKSFAVVARFRLCLPVAAPAGPVQHMPGRGLSNEDELAEQAADLVAGQRDQRGFAAVGAPFTACIDRVATRNAAASMARVMWAYQAS